MAQSRFQLPNNQEQDCLNIVADTESVKQYVNVRQSTISDYDFYKNVSHTRKHKSVIGWLLRMIEILNKFVLIITAQFIVRIKLTNSE